MQPKKQNKTPTVDELMAALQHPLKVEIEAVRAVILNANHKIQERVKWNSPSFHLDNKDLAAIHTRAQDCVHVVFVFHHGHMLESEGLLEGDYKDRRMAKFYSMEDIINKKTALAKFVNDWVELMEEK